MVPKRANVGVWENDHDESSLRLSSDFSPPRGLSLSEQGVGSRDADSRLPGRRASPGRVAGHRTGVTSAPRAYNVQFLIREMVWRPRPDQDMSWSHPEATSG